MGLRTGDLKFCVERTLEIDSYKSKMGEDKDIVTISFAVNGEQPAEDLVKFIESGYDFVLDADKTSGEQSDGKFRVFVELERSKKIPASILEIVDGVAKLSEIDNFRFRYYKNFKSLSLNNETLSEVVPLDKEAYDVTINEVQLENYKNFFSNSYADHVDLVENTLIIKNTFRPAERFEVIDFGKSLELKETINVNDMAEVLWLTKFIGDYNITKYGPTLVLENQGYSLQLKRV